MIGILKNTEQIKDKNFPTLSKNTFFKAYISTNNDRDRDRYEKDKITDKNKLVEVKKQ